jgi:hypothetical protein
MGSPSPFKWIEFVCNDRRIERPTHTGFSRKGDRLALVMMDLPPHTISPCYCCAAAAAAEAENSCGNSGSLQLLSHSWLAVLMAQRARNSNSTSTLALASKTWGSAAVSSLLLWQGRPSTACVRSKETMWRRMAPTGSSPFQQHRTRGTPRRRSTLQYYSRKGAGGNNNNNNTTKDESGGGTKCQDRSSAEQLPKSHDDVRASILQPPRTPTAPLDDNEKLQRQWKEYQEHERMSQVAVSQEDGGATSDDYAYEEEKKEDSNDDASVDALPTVIRVPRAIHKEEDADSSVVSDLSNCDHDDEEDDDDDRDEGREDLFGETYAAEARTESPGRRRRCSHKVKISVTGTGQVPPVRPWIVPILTEVRHDPTWGMITAEIQDHCCQDDWPSDEDDANNKTNKKKNDTQVSKLDGTTAAILKSSPATTISLSSSSLSSPSTYSPRRDQHPLNRPGSGRNTPECASPELQPSRLFRDFRKNVPHPPSSKPHAAAAHSRSRHALVGGSAVLVQVERRQDKSSSTPSREPPFSSHVQLVDGGQTAASDPRVGTSPVSCS